MVSASPYVFRAPLTARGVPQSQSVPIRSSWFDAEFARAIPRPDTECVKDGWVSVAQIAALLTERGLASPSRDQCKRLTRYGLLAAPRQVRQRGVRGSTTQYPAEAVEQLARVIECRASERRFDEITLTLWLANQPVEPRAVRFALGTTLDSFVRELRAFSRGRTPSQAGDAIGRPAVRRQLVRNPFYTLIASRLNYKDADIESALHILMMLVLGDEPILDQPVTVEGEIAPQDILRRVFGFTLFGNPMLVDSDRPFAEIDPRETIETLRSVGILPITTLASLTAKSTDAEIITSQRYAVTFTAVLGSIAIPLEEQCGRDAMGLRAVSIAAKPNKTGASMRALLAASAIRLAQSLDTDDTAQINIAALTTLSEQITKQTHAAEAHETA